MRINANDPEFAVQFRLGEAQNPRAAEQKIIPGMYNSPL